MLNILLFFTFNTSVEDWRNSGTLEREINYYNKLSKNNKINITFFTYGDEKDLKIIQKLNTNINILTLFKKKKYKNNILVFFRSLIFIYLNSKFLKNYDVFKSNQNYGSWLAVICKFIFKKKLISRCGYDLFHFALLEKRPIKIFLSYIICFLIYNNADEIFVPSNFYKNFIKKYFFTKNKKIHIIPNYIDTFIFKRHKEIERSQNKILFVGRLEKQKNLYNTIKLFNNYDFKLDILGNGSLKKKLNEFIKKNLFNVSFITKTYKNQDLPSLFNKYNFIILLSHYEGNPKILLEAMSCQICPIVSNVPGINNLIINNRNGLIFDLNKTENITKKLKKLSKDELIKMQVNAKNTVKNNNRLELIIKSEQKIINELF